MDGPGDGGIFIIGLTSGLSLTEHVFPSIKISTTNGTCDRVVVGFLVAFSVVFPLKIFSADVAGIGL